LGTKNSTHARLKTWPILDYLKKKKQYVEVGMKPTPQLIPRKQKDTKL
jgi:hypothetical protein